VLLEGPTPGDDVGRTQRGVMAEGTRPIAPQTTNAVEGLALSRGRPMLHAFVKVAKPSDLGEGEM
jgi:hypothetical protein